MGQVARHTLILVKSEFDLHVETERGMDGCGRCGWLSRGAGCGEATCETVSRGSLVEGMPTGGVFPTCEGFRKRGQGD